MVHECCTTLLLATAAVTHSGCCHPCCHLSHFLPEQGLVKYDYSTAEVTLLASRVSDSSPIDPGSEITYANDLAIAADGKIYFTSCSDIVPARNSEGFYDTFKAWTLGMAQVRVQRGLALGVRV